MVWTIENIIILTAKNEFSKGEVSTYEDLANPKFKGKVCSRPGSHVYNRALMASMIANNVHDKAKTEKDFQII